MKPSMEDGNVFVYDAFAWKLAETLLEDFKPFVRESFHDAAKAALAARNVGDFRALTCGMFEIENQTPYQLKTERQITDLFKKFSFSQDVFTPKELQDVSKRKFLDNQERLMNFTPLIDDPFIKDVVWRARGWCEKILGDLSHLEICERATFGKKSSVGIPMRHACEGARYEVPITGSVEHIDWFKAFYSAFNRPAFQYAEQLAASREAPLTRSIDYLEAVLVPKTWKSLRMILPNTTLGTLYSSGIGRVIEDRLRKFGYDIKHLQPVHGELARQGSITGSLVTADQSMASDNITVALVNMVFPKRWAQALQFGRISRMSLYGDMLESPTYATMGIGFTFPLQTLLFLVLLLAIRDSLNLDEGSVISVFGDDLVYATEMHHKVVEVFPKLGLVLNIEKTFATGSFRESCGFDYYRGIDVRPAHLSVAEGITAPKRRAEAYLYKTINSLMRRWGPYEISLTTAFIRGEIQKIRRCDPLVVPFDFPDTSGVKYDRALIEELQLPDPSWVKDGSRFFRYLAFEADVRAEERHAPYLWLRLRSKSSVMELTYPVRGHGVVLSEMTPILKEVDHPDRGSVRSELTGRRYRRKLTVIPQQDSGRYRERTGVSITWNPWYHC